MQHEDEKPAEQPAPVHVVRVTEGDVRATVAMRFTEAAPTEAGGLSAGFEIAAMLERVVEEELGRITSAEDPAD